MSLRDTATEIVRRLQTAGFAAYWVGGCVRDYLLGREPQDFDIATSAVPEEIEALFRRTIPVGRKLGVLIVLENSHEFQVATFRAEADYQDGRHPEQVQFADAQADASRRDFTVNGLFYDPVRQAVARLGGRRGGLAREIVADHRFAGGTVCGGDHLRLLRAVRFAAQLNFTIEPATFAALRANAPKILTVSAERIRAGVDETVSSAPRGAGLGFVARQRFAGTGAAGNRGDDFVRAIGQLSSRRFGV